MPGGTAISTPTPSGTASLDALTIIHYPDPRLQKRCAPISRFDVRLARLAERVQVLSVTHAPQVAARAGRHLLISKGPTNSQADTVKTRVEPIETDSRRDEIARLFEE